MRDYVGTGIGMEKRKEQKNGETGKWDVEAWRLTVLASVMPSDGDGDPVGH